MQADHNVPGCSPGIFFAIFSDLAARMAGKSYFAAASFLSVFLKPAKANVRLPDAHAVAWLQRCRGGPGSFSSLQFFLPFFPFPIFQSQVYFLANEK